MAPHLLRVHLGARAGEDDLAAVHHREGVGELVDEIEILLDQQDGDVALALAARRWRGRYP